MTKQEQISSRNVMAGDTILIGNGEMKTVTKLDAFYFQRNPKQTITRILFPKWYQGEILCYAAQV